MAFGMNTLNLNPFKAYSDKVKTNIQEQLASQIAPKPQKLVMAQNPALPQAQQPQGLQSVEPISQAGQIYKQRVTQNLLNPNPLAQSAQAQADTNISRRNYLTQKQTQETMAQSPFGAGTRQYQRAMLEGQAGANQANLGEQNQVNAYTRQLSDQAMEKAQGLEDTEFARSLGERGYQDQNASRYSALIQDTKGRQAYNRLVASGVNPSVALQQVLDESGTIKEGYRGQSNMQQLQSEAQGWVDMMNDPTIPQATKDRLIAIDKAQNEPLNDATQQRKIEEALVKQRKGQKLTPEETELLMGSGNIDQRTLLTIPKGEGNVNEWLKNNPNKQVNIDGQIYTVERGGRETTSYEDKLIGPDKPRHTDYVEVKDPQGNTKYIWGGKINNGKP